MVGLSEAGKPRDLDKAWADNQPRAGATGQRHERFSRRLSQRGSSAGPRHAPYFAQLLGIDPLLKPWTGHLMRCATAVAHIAYMYFKAPVQAGAAVEALRGSRRSIRTARAPGVSERAQHGRASGGAVSCFRSRRLRSFTASADKESPHGPRRAPTASELRGASPPQCPLLWLADRIARNRERLGFHYPSDSAGRAPHRHQDLGVRLRLKKLLCCRHSSASSIAPPPSGDGRNVRGSAEAPGCCRSPQVAQGCRI